MSERRSWLTRRRAAVLIALALPLGVVVLYAYPPTESSYYPRCILHAATGLHCPGCGSARALHLLTHGRVGDALAENALLVLAVPYLIVWGLSRLWAALLDRPTPRQRPAPARILVVAIAFLLAYSVARNVPYYPWTLLAPRLLPEAEPADGQRGSTTKVGTVEPQPAVTLSRGSVEIRVRTPSM